MPTQHKNTDNSPLWTTRRLLNWTTQFLQSKNVDSPRLAAELLLAEILELPRIKLYMELDRPASPLERAAYRELVEQAAKHEPVQYLIGKAAFFSSDFIVNKHVLIPRPSTETLVQHVIQHSRLATGFDNPLIADIGTGSGCIAISLAKHIQGSHIIATDISAEALEIAQNNAKIHSVNDQIEFRRGPLFEPLQNSRFAFIISNPPYISDAEWQQVAPNVRDYEPTSALRAGTDGLDIIKPLIQNAHNYLQTPSQLVIEIAASQKKTVLDLARNAQSLTDPHVIADAQGFDRMLIADSP